MNTENETKSEKNYMQQVPVQEKYIPCAICRLSKGIVHPHFHDAIEIIFTTAGQGTAICNGAQYQQSPGSVFIAASNVVHYYADRTDETDGLVIDIEPSVLLGYAKHLPECISNSYIWTDSQMQDQLWELVNFIYRCRNTLCQPALIAVVSSLIILLMENMELKIKPRTNSSIDRIISYCQKHYREPISLDILSKELNLSITHISRIFTKNLKIGFPEYINALRINEAVKLLCSTDLTVARIAECSGFPTHRTFNRIFMDQYGITPSQYRKSNQ